MLVYDCVSIVFLLRLCLFVPTDSINFKLKTFRYIRSIKSTEMQSGTNGSLLLDHEEKKKYADFNKLISLLISYMCNTFNYFRGEQF